MFSAKDKQALDVLAGERNPDSQHAVRRGQLKALTDNMRVEMTAKKLTTAPTAADYNLLVDDIAALYTAVNALRVNL